MSDIPEAAPAGPAGSGSAPAIEVKHRGLITLSIMAATIMQVLDTTIANVALPSMTGDLGASQDTITWVLTSYIVASAIMTPVTGWPPAYWTSIRTASSAAAAARPSPRAPCWGRMRCRCGRGTSRGAAGADGPTTMRRMPRSSMRSSLTTVPGVPKLS